MKKLSALILSIVAMAGLSGCVSHGQGIMAKAINNFAMPDISVDVCKKFEGKPGVEWASFVKEHKLLPGSYKRYMDESVKPNGYYVYLYTRGNFRAAITPEQDLKPWYGTMVVPDVEKSLVVEAECWKDTDPTPPSKIKSVERELKWMADERAKIKDDQIKLKAEIEKEKAELQERDNK